jgi:hypothetical protein
LDKIIRKARLRIMMLLKRASRIRKAAICHNQIFKRKTLPIKPRQLMATQLNLSSEMEDRMGPPTILRKRINH